MRLAFECTVSDVAETSLERYRAAGAIRRTELGFGVATALLLGAATAARTGGLAGVVAGLASAVLAFVVYRRAAHWLQRRLIRRTWREHLGTERVQVTVELAPRGLQIRYGSHESVTPWPDVLPPQEVAGGLKLRDRQGPLLVVPARAFAQPEEAAEFRRELAEAGSAG